MKTEVVALVEFWEISYPCKMPLAMALIALDSHLKTWSTGEAGAEEHGDGKLSCQLLKKLWQGKSHNLQGGEA